MFSLRRAPGGGGEGGVRVVYSLSRAPPGR